MKIAILAVLLAAVSAQARGQETNFDLDVYNAALDKIQKTGMVVLGSWAAANFVGNGIALLAAPDPAFSPTARNFMIMNIGWNVVNAGLAGFGLFSGNSSDSFDLSATIKRQYKAEKIFLFNTGLDVGYIAFGLFLTARSASSQNPEMLSGFGYSLMLQGAFLLVFDAAMQIFHAKHRKELDNHLSNLPF